MYFHHQPRQTGPLSSNPTSTRAQAAGYISRVRAGLLGGCLAVLALLAVALPGRSGTLDPAHIKEFTFKSGLRLIVKESHATDLAAVQVWIRAGGFLEDERTAGTAHVIEHMVFKGTETGGPGSIDGEIENLGGLLEASTEKDYTRFGCTVAGRYVGKVISVVADALRNAEFRPQDFESEKSIILEEINQIRINPERSLSALLYEMAYQKHPYRHDVRGTPRFINQVDLAAVKAFYEKHYVPANMTVVVVGDVDTAGVERAVKSAFKADDPVPAASAAPLPEEEMACAEPQRRVLNAPFANGYVALAYPAPSVKDDPEVHAMDVLLTVLEHAGSGRLPRLLQGVGAVQAVFETRRQKGLLLVTAMTGPNVEQVEALLRKEIDFLSGNLVPEAVLSLAKRELRGAFALDNEPYAGQAGTLGYYAAIDRWQFAAEYLRKIEAVTAEQVRAVAKKYLDNSRSAAVLFRPRVAAPRQPGTTTSNQKSGVGLQVGRLEGRKVGEPLGTRSATLIREPGAGLQPVQGLKVGTAVASSAARWGDPPLPVTVESRMAAAELPVARLLSFADTAAVVPAEEAIAPVEAAVAPAKPASPPAKTAAPARSTAKPAARPAVPARKRPPTSISTLSNGLRLLCRPNNSTEMVSIVCLVRAGLMDEREDQAGIAALTAEALVRGSTTYPGDSFLRAVLKAGGALRSLPGFDFAEISIVTSKDQFEYALKLIADVLAHPRFGEEEVNAAKEILKRRAATLRDDFTGASYQGLVGQLYPRSPYGRPMTGSAQTLDRITAEDVRKFWQANYVQNRMVVGIVGDVDPHRTIGLAQKAFRDVPYRVGANGTTPIRDILQRPRVEALQRVGPAAQVMVGFLTPGATRDNYAVYAVLDAIVGGGKRARLFRNIREKADLGYELGSFYQPLLYQSHLVGYVVTPAFRLDPKTEQPMGTLEPVRNLLLDQYRQLLAAPPTDAELVRARNYVIGRYALRQERTRDQAKWLAWNEAMALGRDFDEAFPSLVHAVTREQIQAAAKRVLGNYALVVTIPSQN